MTGSGSAASAIGAGDAARPAVAAPEPDAVTSSSGSSGGHDTRGEPLRAEGNRKQVDHKRSPPRVATVTRRSPPPAPAGDEKSVAALVNRAKALEKDNKWNEARAVYQKLEKVKGYSLGEALYRQAYAAIQSNATEDAMKLASEAGRQPGSFKTPAMFLYGDAWYRQGEFGRAKEIFITLRKGLAGDERAVATKKIATCNKALKLPEGDGIVD
jgi:TolA-binding protein